MIALTPKQRLLILLALIILILALILYFAWPKSNPIQAPIKQASAPTAGVKSSQSATATTNPLPPATPEEKKSAEAKLVALTFVERFGTFSNDSADFNVSALKPMVTDALNTWLNNTYLPQQQALYSQDKGFYRLTAIAPVADVLEERDGFVKFEVSAQRVETKGPDSEKKFLQNIIVELVKSNNDWLVNSAYWQARR